MPMDTTCSIRLPVTPFHSPERTFSAKAYMRSSMSRTSATQSWSPSNTVPRSESGRRSAVWSTARSSEVLTCAPEYMASRRSSTWSSRASWTSSFMVSSVTRFLDRSMWNSPMSKLSLDTRSGSAANQPLRSTPAEVISS